MIATSNLTKDETTPMAEIIDRYAFNFEDAHVFRSKLLMIFIRDDARFAASTGD
jgi:hypothetical protein